MRERRKLVVETIEALTRAKARNAADLDDARAWRDDIDVAIHALERMVANETAAIQARRLSRNSSRPKLGLVPRRAPA